MDTLLGEKLKNAINTKNSNINSFIWKGSKVLNKEGKYTQSEKKIIEMTEFEMLECYEHCKTMLFNKNTQNPGRWLVLDEISDQRDKCGTELFLRSLEQNNKITRFTLLEMITTFLNNNRDTFKEYKPIISDMFSNISTEFNKISLSLLMDGCLDRLGAFTKKHITRTFILKQGIWLTPSESKDLIEYREDGSLIDRLEVIKERLGIKEIEELYINSKGLNYSQMRAMLSIRPNKKYADMTTVQLETLRNRMLFSLEETVKNHILSWENRMDQIEKCAEFKGFKL